jgi:tRNA-uridine 2-sulfurtransferase
VRVEVDGSIPSIVAAARENKTFRYAGRASAWKQRQRAKTGQNTVDLVMPAAKLPTRDRVLCAMSGGVDSSVAAAMLVEQGYDVVGATMKLFCHGTDVPDRPCCSLDSVNDARRVCEQLGIPHYVINLEDRFGSDVIDNFVDEYARGRTPIPCVRCNTFTKFRDLVRKADGIDAKYVATGHYARMVNGELHRGVDENKDQTYFMWGIDRAVLSRMLLPVGEMTKAETRTMAHKLGLEVIAEKPESQEICFVPDGDYMKILRERLPADAPALSKGPIVTSAGRVIGEHEGYARYTIGQRRGLPGGFAEPIYVVAIRPKDRAVVVGPREELLGRGVIAREVNWLTDPPPVGATVHVRVRHRAPLAAGELLRVDDNEIEVALDEPVAAITAGQSLAIYDPAGAVLGGGFIEGASRSSRALRTIAA